MLIPNPPSPILQLIPLSLLFNVHFGISPRVKWPGREADYSQPSSVEIKKEWRHKFTLPHAFTAYTATTWSTRYTFDPSSLPPYCFVYLLQCVLVTKFLSGKPAPLSARLLLGYIMLVSILQAKILQQILILSLVLQYKVQAFSNTFFIPAMEN